MENFMLSNPNRVISCRELVTECGVLLLGALDGALVMCDWIEGRRHERNKRRLLLLSCAELSSTPGDIDLKVLENAVSQLMEYFAGERRNFDLPVTLFGTEFSRKVWNTLLDIPYGAKVSYREIAERTGNTKGVRATANAVGSNPLSVIVPCHRVVGADGSLTGYAGGLDAKRFLLDLEADTIHQAEGETSRNPVPPSPSRE